MKEMVNAFSDYARTPQINLRPLQLNTIVQEVLDLYQIGSAKLTRQMDTHLPKINADSSRLRQVLHNLLKNALESHPEQAHITITTRHRQKSPHSTGFDYVELRLEDNGTGIPEDKIDQIFEPYFTSKAKGTGLGLAIVKKIIEEHGGLIWMENRENGGACAVMRFPYKTSETTETPVETRN
jgi:nitrogen fixation/metabolism regulation signal transduction histidine kinase